MMDRSHLLKRENRKLLAPAPALRQPVSMEVPVRVQGEANGHATFFEDTNTVLVFQEGAVLRVAGYLQAGQSLLLTNRATRQQAACRVAYVKQHGSVRGYAEVEFAMPAPGFWEETPAGPAVAQSISASAAAAILPPVAPAPAIRASESLAHVSNLADPIRSARDSAPVRIPQSPATENPMVPGPAAHAAAPVDEIERMLATKRVETDAQAQDAARAAGEFVSRLLDPASQVAFAPRAGKSWSRWVLGAIAAALLLTIGTSLGSWGLQAEVARAVPPAPVAPAPPAWAVSGWLIPIPPIADLPLRTPRTRLSLFILPPESVRRAAELHMALSKARLSVPIAAPRTANDAAAPDLEKMIPANMPALALAPTTPERIPAPVVPVESKLEPLRLLFASRPVYPPTARRAGTQGEVMIHARVDETGKVVLMRVISGPLSLRQAALDALSQWKYEPARLNGKPVSVDTAVSIKFQL